MSKNMSLTEKQLSYVNATYNVRPYIIEKIEGDNRKTIYCDKCGNLANMVLIDFLGLLMLYVPLCKTHGFGLLDAKPELTYEERRKTILDENQCRLHLELLREN